MVMIVAEQKEHITTTTAFRSESLFLQEGKDKVIIQHEACLPL